MEGQWQQNPLLTMESGAPGDESALGSTVTECRNLDETVLWLVTLLIRSCAYERSPVITTYDGD